MTDWKRIDGYDNYEVSKYGEVRNITTGNYLNGSVNNCGYIKITLCKDKKGKYFSFIVSLLKPSYQIQKIKSMSDITTATI